jgi:hypothetical protein
VDAVTLALKAFFAGLATLITPVLAWMNGVATQKAKQQQQILDAVQDAKEISEIADTVNTNDKRKWLRKRFGNSSN